MIKIEKTNYNWTINGPNILKLSSASLFSKLIVIFQNYHTFNKEKVKDIILKYIDNNDWMFKEDNNKENIISESRQAYSGLMNLGYNYNFGIKLDGYYGEQLYFMEESYWENPWKAGAHLSHYIFFCNLIGKKEEIESILIKLEKYAKKDGWYFGNPSDEKKINGIMKVMTAYDVIKRKIDKEMLFGITDRILLYKDYKGGCGIYDYVYILVRCYETGYRCDEIKKTLYELYDKILEHQMEDGGFKYSLNREKRDKYGGVEVGLENEGCIHGSVLFGMTLMMMDEVLEMGLGLGRVET